LSLPRAYPATRYLTKYVPKVKYTLLLADA
jgi:hypothetical protein